MVGSHFANVGVVNLSSLSNEEFSCLDAFLNLCADVDMMGDVGVSVSVGMRYIDLRVDQGCQLLCSRYDSSRVDFGAGVDFVGKLNSGLVDRDGQFGMVDMNFEVGDMNDNMRMSLVVMMNFDMKPCMS
jgi:hypothetical protein